MLSCVVLTHFAAGVEQQLNLELRDIPFLIVTSGTRRKVVATSAAPRQMGVLPGTTLRQALILCPDAEVLTHQPDIYQCHFEQLTRLLLMFTDRVEPEYQPTTAAWYLNLTTEFNYLIGAVHNQYGVTPSIGVASNKFTARVAAAYAAYPVPQIISVPQGGEGRYLSAFPITLLPLDKEMKRLLPIFGIHTFGQYARLPRQAVFEQFGKHGTWVHDLASGKDIRPIQSYHPPLVLSQTYRVEDEPLADYQFAENILRRLTELLIHQLSGKQTHHLSLTLGLENKQVLECHRQPPEPVTSVSVLVRHLMDMLVQQPLTCGIVSLEIQLSQISQPKPVQFSFWDAEDKPVEFNTLVSQLQPRHQRTEFHKPVLTLTPPNYALERQFDLEKVVSA